MKVLILGGYGVFGSRLAQLLLRDGHDVIIAGRSLQKAQTLCMQIGGTPFQIDMRGDLTPIASAHPDVVVDAAGPFQHYGDAPLRIAEFCMHNHIHYLDLSDDAAFTTRISDLDGLAKSTGCFALSGASSVPALSAAVVTDLARDMTEIECIDTAIVPGNNAPRGRSVVASVLAQIGAPLTIWRGGRWQTVTGWSEPLDCALPGRLHRTARLIGAPDPALFPDHFYAKTVLFRAGTELAFMNRTLAMLAALRRAGLFRPTAWVESLATWGYQMLKPLGSQKGGMCVTVSGPSNADKVTKTWWLLAETGDGPFVPVIPIRALLRKPDQILPGARPCLDDLKLCDVIDAMADLDIETTTRQSTPTPLFKDALGDQWARLPAEIHRLHQFGQMEEFTGAADVERGSDVIGRLIALLFRFPRAAAGIPVTVRKQRTAEGEVWERQFGDHRFRSHLRPSSSASSVREQFWPFDFDLPLRVEDSVLHLPVGRGWLLGMPWPRFLLPKSDAREYVENRQFHFDVTLSAPLTGGLIVRYRGFLVPVATEDTRRKRSATPPPSPPRQALQS